MDRTRTALEKEVKDLRAIVDLLYGVVIEGKPYSPDAKAYDDAIVAAYYGDVRPLKRFIEMGGIIPGMKGGNVKTSCGASAVDHKSISVGGKL